MLVLGVIGVIEELATSLNVYAGYEHARYERTLRSALGIGAHSGRGHASGREGQHRRLTDLEAPAIGDCPAVLTFPLRLPQ
ncbi:hypothetical protein C8039_02505 [Halogeometricum sp. wsp3]|nr:hypothetical protein C8039_02505 [Halogeometricum sp. wsp3]